MNEYLDIKNQAIEDSKSMNFEGMTGEQKQKAALLKLKENENIDNLDVKSQMVYVANLLIPDDEQFLKDFSEDRSIKNLAQKYGYSDFVINTKVTELKDEIDKLETKEEVEVAEPTKEEKEEIKGDNNMEELSIETPQVEQENNTISMESFDLKPNEEVTGQKSSNLQETVDMLAALGSAFKTKSAQEETIDDQEKTIKELNDRIKNLEDTVKGKDDEIDSLKETIEEFTKAKRDLEEEVAKRDETIEEQEEELASDKKQINDLNETINKKDDKIASQEEVITSKDKEIDGYKTTIQEKDAMIADRDEKIEDNVIQFDTLSKKYAILKDENEAKDRKIKEQDEYIGELEGVKADYIQLASAIKEFTASKSEQNGPRLAA